VVDHSKKIAFFRHNRAAVYMRLQEHAFLLRNLSYLVRVKGDFHLTFQSFSFFSLSLSLSLSPKNATYAVVYPHIIMGGQREKVIEKVLKATHSPIMSSLA